MKGFISELAERLYDRYGDEVSSLRMVFPSRRARLFFSDALASVARRPLWQPRFESLGEIMERVAGMRLSDEIKLVTELYKVYSRYHDESFDAFYFWGGMLLADFDQIDKYLIDADMLFSNVGDLKALESDRSYLTAEQIEVIARFWRSFGLESEFSEEKERFMTIWRSMADVYHGFRDRLCEQGLAYEGMIHREAAERLSGEEAVEWSDDPQARYVVAGFNALSECEKRLFRRMHGSGRVEFYWDYDDYYVGNPDYEAGLFLRENIRNFPSPSDERLSCDRFRRPKRIEIVSAPSDSMQCKYVHEFLSGLIERGIRPGKQTAIVLTDESLLLPVLYSIPEQVEQVNVTMGYPLRQTMAYSFVERLVELQSRRKPGRDGEPMYYHSDVTGLLLHPYVRACDPAAAGLAAEILRRQSIYVRRSTLAPGSVIDPLFAPAGSWQELSAYVRDSLSLVILHAASADDVRQRREFFSVIVDRICRLELARRERSGGHDACLRLAAAQNAAGCAHPLRGRTAFRRADHGDTRDAQPRFRACARAVGQRRYLSRQPGGFVFVHSLQSAVCLRLADSAAPRGVYAYYFYRLLQRAETVHLAYCSRSDDKRTGEPSRYIYQLEYESPHRPLRRAIRLGVNLTKTEPVSASKTGRTARILEEYLDGGGRSLSPTAFYQYVECPLRFYFRHVAGLKPVEEIAEEIDLPMFGTILHRAMELLYVPLLGDPSPQRTIASLPGTPAVKEAVVRAVNEEYLQDPKATEEEYGGNVLLVRDVVRKYVDSGILPYDASQQGYVVERLEAPVEYRVPRERDGRVRSVGFVGKADRIDRLSDGALRVVDYKTGKPHNCFRDVAALFSSVAAERSPAVLQTLLYAMMLSQSEGCDVQPALYYVRSMQDERFSPLLVEGDRPVLRFSDYRESLNGHLRRTLSELFDFSRPFEQCEDRSVCAYCDFREICRR
ncbi:MAG: PD-(D/E)XK nuclease family protein [Alistipes sp.]